jgi:hypothetical protein
MSPTLSGILAAFIEKLETAGPRRVIITVNAPPPTSAQRVLFELLYGEEEEVEPGHVELVHVLWEKGLLPDVRVLPESAVFLPGPFPTHEAAVTGAMARFGAQWAFWPRSPELDEHLRSLLEARFSQLFEQTADGFWPAWFIQGREIPITWRPGLDVQQA